MGRKVTQAVVSYMDGDGHWQTALRGAEIDVHPDDLGRLEAAGAFDAAATSVADDVVVEDLSDVVEPPRSGRGSGLEAWVDYAEGQGIEVPEGASRDDVIALVDAEK